MKGNGTPMTGSTPLTMATLMRACPMIQVTEQEMLLENVSRLRAMGSKKATASVRTDPGPGVRRPGRIPPPGW